MKNLFFYFSVFLFLNCTSTENSTLSNDSPSKQNTQASKTSDGNEWGYIKIFDDLEKEEITFWLTPNQYKWLKQRPENQLDFIQVYDKPIYISNSRKVNFIGDNPVTPYPHNPSNPLPNPFDPPMPFDNGDCKPSSFQLNNTVFTGDCNSKKQQFITYQQELADSNCEEKTFSKICCGNKNIGPLIFIPSEPCTPNPPIIPGE